MCNTRVGKSIFWLLELLMEAIKWCISRRAALQILLNTFFAVNNILEKTDMLAEEGEKTSLFYWFEVQIVC